MRPANAMVFLISEFRSRICRQKTGSYYKPSCPGWKRLLGDAMFLNGRYYRYRVEPASGNPRVGPLDLQVQPAPIDLTL